MASSSNAHNSDGAHSSLPPADQTYGDGSRFGPPPKSTFPGQITYAVISLVIAGAVVVGLLYLVPLARHDPETFSISSEGGFKCGWGPNLTVAHDGTFVFSWAVNDSTSVSFVMIAPPGVAMFSTSYSSGTATVDVDGGSQYQFQFCSGGPATLQLTGTLNFAIPVL